MLSTTLRAEGSNRAAVVGTEGRIEIDSVWYAPTTFTRYDREGDVVERWDEQVTGRGGQFQAWEVERLIESGGSSQIMPPDESVRIMETLDEVRRQIGLSYPDIDA